VTRMCCWTLPLFALIPLRMRARLIEYLPLGVTLRPRGTRFDLFLEMVPVMDLAPATELDLNAALGGRFYF
jgi:hypothetical protein